MNVMIVFQVSLTFDPVKKNTENTVPDLYLMKKVIILKKIQVTTKSFPPPFFNHFSLSLNEKTCSNESHEKQIKYIYASAANFLHIRIGNLKLVQIWALQKRSKRIDCCGEVDAMLVTSAKIPKLEGSISPSSFYGQLPDY